MEEGDSNAAIEEGESGVYAEGAFKDNCEYVRAIIHYWKWKGDKRGRDRIQESSDEGGVQGESHDGGHAVKRGIASEWRECD